MRDESNLIKTERSWRWVALTLPLGLVLGGGLGILVSINQLKVVERNRVEQASALIAQRETNTLQQYLADNRNQWETVMNALPDELGLVGLIEDIETILTEVDSQSTIKLGTNTPVRVGGDLVIQIIVKFRSDWETGLVILEKLNKLPYLMQMTNLEIYQTDKEVEYGVGFRVFVQEPFSQP